MATSAATYQSALELLAKKYSFDLADAKKALAGKGYLPKKLLVGAKPKAAATPFASKAASEFAAKHSVDIKGLKGTSVKGLLTVKDLEATMDTAVKISVSPAAAKYARDNKISLDSIRKDGKILLGDVKAHEADTEPESDDDEIKLSTAAARAVKQYEIEDEDLEDIKATGKKGVIVLADLKALIKEIKDAESDSDSDSE